MIKVYCPSLGVWNGVQLTVFILQFNDYDIEDDNKLKYF